MSTRVAPWLQGLDEAWEVPAGIPMSANVSSASHDANSLRSNSSRLPRRSFSGLPSSLGSQKTASQATTQLKRSPLAPLSKSTTNTCRQQNGTTRTAGTRSVSDTSQDSLLQCGTVQQRSKSASPAKKQQTLEWKKRLVNGQVGYGDQTDLFGRSGLENIFARSSGPENDKPKKTSWMNRLQKSDATMPSSPPPWPSSFTDGPQSEDTQAEMLEQVEEEQYDEDEEYDEHRMEDSFRSNPFDLHHTDEAEGHSQLPADTRSDDREMCEGAGIANRTVSGQTELEQEDFSPVFISKHTTVTGQVNYAALDSHQVKRFNSRNVNLRHPSQEQPEQEQSDEPDYEEVQQSAFEDGPQSDSLTAGPDLSLSENLPTGTPPVPSLGRNIEFKRGGYSAYGSFKQRPLSPSPSRLEGSAVPEGGELLSPSTAYARPLPPAPVEAAAPTTPLRPTTPSPAKSRSSGSPLKLFGAHDTFTNNRLLRRMSQLEPEGNPMDEGRHTEATQDEVDANRRVLSGASHNSFGSGHLDHHTFDAEITVTSASDSDKDDSDRSPGSDISVPGSRDPHGFRFEASLEVDTFKLKRKLSKQSAAASKGSTLESHKTTADLQPTVEDASELDASYECAGQVPSFEGAKRPPTSPFKNPTPKRRRTLHASELRDEVAEANISYHYQMQEAISSQKRNDARQDDLHNVADSDTLANRKILRPRNPTPSQRRQQIEAELREAAQEFAAQGPERLEEVMEQIESSMAISERPPTLQQQAAALAAEVANFTLRVQKPSGEHGERKRSITTQDFMNEAVMVMQLIRSKARPQSGLGSVEESDLEGRDDSLQPQESLQEAGESLRISRPPSREGAHSGWRTVMKPQTDARVVSHLRKFQERDDTEFIAESIASLHVDDEDSQNENVVVEDEYSNIRITGPPDSGRRHGDGSDESRPATQDSQGSTLYTQQSAATSTGRTAGTASTRKSENVGTLAPDMVAHLIGEQVGGMTFDRLTQRWVRVRSPGKGRGFLEPPSNLTSDDDPFREISDLPIDEQTELRRISSSGRTTMPGLDAERSTTVHDQLEDQASHQPRAVEERTTSTETVIARPATSDGNHMQFRIHHAHSSSVPSRYTAFGSSQQQDKVETRATSYGDEELARMTALGKARSEPLAYAAAQATLAMRGERDRVEEEQFGNGTELTFPSPPACRPAEKTSPGVVHIEDSLRDDTVVEPVQADINPIAASKLRQSPPKAPHSTWRAAPSHMSMRQNTLQNRQYVEQHGRSELSLVAALPGERMMSLSLSVSRPLATRQQPNRIAELRSSPTKVDVDSTFLLSDLPDFTIHEEDEEYRPSERALAKRLAHHAAAEVNDRYALAVKDLVKTLTDVQEDQPYWEDVKQLDLHDRSVSSLYGLDEFCTRIQDMDISENALADLQGAPCSVRHLNARANMLTSLTSWSHLMNLQYLDISRNSLDSLAGLGTLFHLRELRADDNQITSLDGIQELDGLLKLCLRRNRIQYANFEGFHLERLEELDLSQNRICAVEGLDHLPALESLRLGGNLLKAGPSAQQPMLRLSELSVRNCGLQHLDVSAFANLRLLDADDNSLRDVQGIAGAKNLKCLSLRRQALPDGVRIAILDHPLEACSVRLSGNVLPTLQLGHSYLNLQHLELSSAGLQKLPDDFGLRMPNVRILNLNFNALKDVRPLLNMQNLEQLSVCGNRLDRLRKSVATLAKLTALRSIDFRDNPLTHGFYAPVLTAQTSIARRCCTVDPADEDAEADAIEMAKHSLPPGDADNDKQHQIRLDDETKLRRRVYELLLTHSCPGLENLDGMSFAKDGAGVRDKIWERLVELGVVRKSHGSSPAKMVEGTS